ncbi:putative Late embryogenesis abundant protein Lea5 [Melia azedarach]|uniref:Late embryogenesis abundant protein Lea5 n=1 Tax=Melia azedarach TaxID=155640 RepID=A0ACC1Y0W6_MELAZ|nr:putative Late embryogenesis abundant protein Lea5 [Melia azedarach]
MMARSALIPLTTKMSILREVGKVYRGFSSFTRAVDDEAAQRFTGSLEEKNSKELQSLTCWIPHPRSGIYFPAGHEWVMEDVPKDAASFGGRTLWLRNDDGVEKPDP